MSPLDQVEAFASAIIARDIPIAARDVAAGDALHRAAKGWLIDARAIVFDRDSSPSRRKLAARVIAQWGMAQVDAPSDCNVGDAS